MLLKSGCFFTRLITRSILLACYGVNSRADQTGAEQSTLSLVHAVQVTLEVSPLIRAQEQQLEQVAGVYEATGGQFNTTTQASVGYGISNQPFTVGDYYNSDLPAVSSLSSQNIDYKLGLDKLFRTGIKVAPSIQTTRFSPNGNSQQSFNNTSTINLAITIPLMRGLGKEATAAKEISASHGFEKARNELWQKLSVEVTKTVTAYWDYVAATQKLVVFDMARERNLTLLTQGRRLVEGDIIPRSDLNNYSAALATSEADFARAQQQQIAIRNNLGMAMGISAEYFANIPLPSDDFPKIDDKELHRLQASMAKATEYALSHRNDVLAAEQNILLFQALNIGAENALKPLVNVELNMGYQGLSQSNSPQGMFTPYGQNVDGFTGGARINYQFPPSNDKAKGDYKQTNASLSEAHITKDNLMRSVTSDLQVAANALSQGLLGLNYSSEAMDNRNEAFLSEKKKQLSGLSTVINVTVVAQNLIQSQLAKIEAAQALATSLVRFRYTTATLYAPGDESRDINLVNLTSIPQQFLTD
jgi:outer membrane protein TolC